MGLTLIEAAKYETRLEYLAVIKTFAEGELLRRLPFQNVSGGGVFYGVEKRMPKVGFRAVNEGYDKSEGVIDPQAEAVHPFAGDVDVDRSIVDLQGPDARASQTEMKVRSMRLTLEAALINGDAVANQLRGFDGLAKRLPPGHSQTVDNGGGPLEIEALEELIDSVNSFGEQKFLIMSKASRRQVRRADKLSGQGLYSTYKTSYNRWVHEYQECEILVVDQDAEGHEVLGYGEAAGTTSIYCCAFGDEAVTGLQGQFEGRYGLSVRDFGEVPDAPVFRTRIDWYVGLAMKHPRSGGRLHGIGALS